MKLSANVREVLVGALGGISFVAVVVALAFVAGCIDLNEIPELRDEDGKIDEEKVRDAIDIPIGRRCKFDTEGREIVCEWPV